MPQEDISLQNVLIITRDDATVWSDDNPAAIWMTSENAASNRDLKVSLPGDCQLSHFREPPPKYEHQEDLCQSKIPARGICDRQPIKFLVIAAYFFLIYKITTESFQPNFPAINWAPDTLRSHSRDFMSRIDQEFSEPDDVWFKSRLGKLGSYSPLLTPAEVSLFMEVEWDAEPVSESDDANEANDSDPANLETIFTNTFKDHQPNLPLPFHRPSNLFKLTRNLFNEITRLSHES